MSVAAIFIPRCAGLANFIGVVFMLSSVTAAADCDAKWALDELTSMNKVFDNPGALEAHGLNPPFSRDNKDQVAKLSALVADIFNIEIGFKALREGFPQVACEMIAAVKADPLFQSLNNADAGAAKE